jgi:hypothetical protein
MRKSKYTLDPLWITKGGSHLDAEYYSYILLAANKKFREFLDRGDISNFNEIVFHSLNLNNLVIEGSMIDSDFKPNWKDPKIVQIREHLRKIYEVPDNLLEIFRNANYLLTSLLIDHLDQMLDTLDQSKVYFINPNIYREKEIFFIVSKRKKSNYSVWKIKFDKRFKLGQKVEKVTDLEIDLTVSDDLKNKIIQLNHPKLKGIEGDHNVIFIIINRNVDQELAVRSVAESAAFSKRIGTVDTFDPNILDELYEIILQEKVLPFTIKSWD